MGTHLVLGLIGTVRSVDRREHWIFALRRAPSPLEHRRSHTHGICRLVACDARPAIAAESREKRMSLSLDISADVQGPKQAVVILPIYGLRQHDPFPRAPPRVYRFVFGRNLRPRYLYSRGENTEVQ